MSDEQNDNKHPVKVLINPIVKLKEIFGDSFVLNTEMVETADVLTTVNAAFYHDLRTTDRIRVQCMNKSQEFVNILRLHPIDVQPYLQFHEVLQSVQNSLKNNPNCLVLKLDLKKAYEVFDYSLIQSPFWRQYFSNRVVKIQNVSVTMTRGLFVGGLIDWTIFRQFMQRVCTEIKTAVQPRALHCFADDVFLVMEMNTNWSEITRQCALVFSVHSMELNMEKVQRFTELQFAQYVLQKAGPSKRASYWAMREHQGHNAQQGRDEAVE